MNMLVTSCL